nr:MAG TPA: hypothetical protein [Bacteriophage sp.]DAQ58179.1 MAG TPA: hypothetical protein [Caudoviricetes sp.]
MLILLIFYVLYNIFYFYICKYRLYYIICNNITVNKI